MQLIPCDVCLTQSVAWAFQAVTTKQHRLEICRNAGFLPHIGRDSDTTVVARGLHAQPRYFPSFRGRLP